MSDYMVVTGNIDDLERRVKRALSEGWSLQGGVSIVPLKMNTRADSVPAFNTKDQRTVGIIKTNFIENYYAQALTKPMAQGGRRNTRRRR